LFRTKSFQCSHLAPVSRKPHSTEISISRKHKIFSPPYPSACTPLTEIRPARRASVRLVAMLDLLSEGRSALLSYPYSTPLHRPSHCDGLCVFMCFILSKTYPFDRRYPTALWKTTRSTMPSP
jgi:hypothetical protein